MYKKIWKGKEKMKKTMKIILIAFTFIIIALGVFWIVYKPMYDLNKAVELLKNGEYKVSYDYVINKNNEENKQIVKEIITNIFINQTVKGNEKIATIADKCNNIILSVDRDNIDNTLDDIINIEINSLDSYINLENEISKEMIVEELSDVYDTYFETLKFTRNNFINILDKLEDKEFLNNVQNKVYDVTSMASYLQSFEDNYIYNPKSIDIYEKEIKYFE